MIYLDRLDLGQPLPDLPLIPWAGLLVRQGRAGLGLKLGLRIIFLTGVKRQGAEACCDLMWCGSEKTWILPFWSWLTESWPSVTYV